MAFALTSFFADGVRFMGPGLRRATQKYVFSVTAAASDVDLDFGDATGTFWTAAQADTTYGGMATQVLTQIKNLAAQYAAVDSIFMPQLYSRLQVATGPTGTQYTSDGIDTTTLLPSYTFATTGGSTAYTLVINYVMVANALPSNLDYNVG